MTETRKWSLVAGVLVVAIFAAGWFLLIAPKRSDAAALRADTVTQDEANARLEQQIEVLQAQQADLPAQRARLAVLQKQIPNNPALPTLIRNLTSAGRKVGVTLASLAPAPPVALVSTQPVTPVATTTTTETTSTSESNEEATTAAPVVVAPPAPSLFQVPLTVDVRGSYFELEQFVNRLEGLKRSFLVSGFSIEPDTDEEGDLKLTLQGRVFLSPPVTESTSTSTPVAPAPVAQ